MKDIQLTRILQPAQRPHLAVPVNFSRGQLLPTIKRQRVAADNSMNHLSA
jgi:hypothetical protein